MPIVYHPKFKDCSYANDPAAAEGRIQCIVDELDGYDFVKPKSATTEELELVHPEEHIMAIQKKREKLFDMASLAAGASVTAAELGWEKRSSLAVIRPPGHHASPASCWGFCYFNNMGISLKKLKSEGKIDSAFILDFDMHRGDGNINSLFDVEGAKIMNPVSSDRDDYLLEVKERLREVDCDIVAASAGFDEHVDDWGGKLKTEDYITIGEMLKKLSEKRCGGRRFALLEGGYNHDVLGKNVRAFAEGFGVD